MPRSRAGAAQVELTTPARHRRGVRRCGGRAGRAQRISGGARAEGGIARGRRASGCAPCRASASSRTGWWCRRAPRSTRRSCLPDMTAHWRNLGDAIDRERRSRGDRGHRSRRRARRRATTATASSTRCADAVARGLVARGLRAGRAGRDPVGQPRRVPRRLSRHHAGRARRRAGQLEAAGRRRSTRSCAIATRRLVLCDAAAPDAVPGRSAARRRSAATSRLCSIRGRSARSSPIPASRRCSSTPRGRAGGRKASCCRTGAICGSSRCAAAPPGSPPERPLVAAPLYHMNALAVSQAALAQARHDHPAARLHARRATSPRPAPIARPP